MNDASPGDVAVLTDFGSTYTKVTLVDQRTAGLVASAQSTTTVETDVMDGFEAALAAALHAAGRPVALGPRLSASSAGGGLRVAAVGLVGDLTAAAARQAALNAGGKVELVLSGALGAIDAATLRDADPDIVLFSGGTDGGQRDRVLRNADVVASAGIDAELIVACNREVAEDVARRFERAGLRARAVENTMPHLGELNIEPARAAILDAFLAHVIRGKRLSRHREFAESVVTATPDAVLRSVELLATGASRHVGLGSVAVIDIGGATTDVHAHIGHGTGVVGSATPLLPVSPTMRTVQGDLGMRWSAGGILAADRRWLQAELGSSVDEEVARRETDTALLPADDHALTVDQTLAVAAVRVALARHCGRQFWAFRHNEPPLLTQTGPDLSNVDLVIGTGGVLALRPDGSETLRRGLARLAEIQDLMAPTAPDVIVDRHYVLAAAGLLSTRDPDLAFRFLIAQFSHAKEQSAAR